MTSLKPTKNLRRIFRYTWRFVSLLLLIPVGLHAAASVSLMADAELSADLPFTQRFYELTGPILDEGINRDIGDSNPKTIVLNAPVGFIFDSSASINVSVSRLAGTGALLSLASSNAVVSSSSVTVTVNGRDAADGQTRSRLTWSGVRVRPVSGYPLISGDLLIAGTASVNGLAKISSFGHLKTIPGQVAALRFSRQPSGAAYRTPFTIQPAVRTCDLAGNDSTNNLPLSMEIHLTVTAGQSQLAGVSTLEIGMQGGKGEALFAGLSLNKAEVGVILTASALGLQSAISAPFDVVTSPLTLRGITAQPKVYDGGTAAVIDTSKAILEGVFQGDLVFPDYSNAIGAYQNSKEGFWSVTISGIALSGLGVENYYLQTPATPLVRISPAPLEILGLTIANKVYDGTTAARLASTNLILNGLIPGDLITLGGLPVAQFFDSAVGTNKPVNVTGFVLNGVGARNYSLINPIVAFANITAITPAYLERVLGTVAALHFSGEPDTSYSIMISTNCGISWWKGATVITDGYGQGFFKDTQATNCERFYRVSLPLP